MLGGMSDPLPGPWQSRSQALISSRRLLENARLLSEYAGVPIIAPLKANAYGHGLELTAQILRQSPYVWGYAVAQPQEADALSALNTGKPTLLLTPAFASEYAPLSALGVRLSIGSEAEMRQLPPEARVHLKVETGMNRTGARPEEAIRLARTLAARGQLEGIYTHFAQADEPPPHFAVTLEQLRRFDEVVTALRAEGLDFLAHCANGGGVLSLGKVRGMELARPGLALYGYPPAHLNATLPLKAALRLRARAAFIHEALSGERVSYGGLFTAARPTTIATVQLGYADGYPRRASLKAQAAACGELRPVLGKVCMDQLMVDVTGLDVRSGDWLDFIDGQRLTLSQLAQWSDMSEYELLTRLGSRVERLRDDSDWDAEG